MNIPESTLQLAAKMIAAGVKWPAISAATGLSSDAIRRQLDPGYAKHRNAGKAESRAAARKARTARSGGEHVTHYVSKIPPAEAERALRSIPADTRTRSARLLGDPLPGRSALDRKNNHGASA